jgi:serine/threonine-protein kinase
MDMTLPPVFDEYEIEDEIGCGNLTTVYRARRKSDGKCVSIKLVMPEFTADRVFVRRFLEAGGRSIRLDHPNIARVYEVSERDGVVYVVREYLEATCLAEWMMQQGEVPPTVAVNIVRQLASALDYAHSRRMMHGDINDRCIYVDSTGHVKLADFGLVQAVAGTDLGNHQARGVRLVQGMGAPEYLAPERVQGQGPSRSADIYALGVVAYRLLTGHPPFAGEAEEVLEAQVYQTPPPAHTEVPTVSPTISASIARALAKRPELRYNTATEFARAFAAAAEGIAPGRGPVVTSRPKPAAPPRKPPAVVVAVIGVAIVVALLAWFWKQTDLGERLSEQLALLLPSPVPIVSPTPEAVTPSPAAPSATSTRASTPTRTATAAVTTTPEPTVTPTAGASPTSTPPATAVVSPAPPVETGPPAFANLAVAEGIGPDNSPLSVGTTFTSARRPLYVFFEYRNMTPAMRWGHVWRRGTQELNRTIEPWPRGWGAAGRAWIFYTPDSSYLPGNYEVQLLINDQVAATVAFRIE